MSELSTESETTKNNVAMNEEDNHFPSTEPSLNSNYKLHRRRPYLYLIITNISKWANIRSLLLTAAAFGCKTVFVAGQRKFDFDPEGKDYPNQLRNYEMEIKKFDKLEECIHHIRAQKNKIRILGVEIDESSVDVEDNDIFFTDTAFMMGNEGQGMNTKQMSLCDGFVRISQYGGGTASLNVNVAASIVLHRFQLWARTNSI